MGGICVGENGFDAPAITIGADERRCFLVTGPCDIDAASVVQRLSWTSRRSASSAAAEESATSKQEVSRTNESASKATWR